MVDAGIVGNNMSKANLHDRFQEPKEIGLFGNRVFMHQKLKDFEICIDIIQEMIATDGDTKGELQKELDVYETIVRIYKERLMSINKTKAP